MELKSYQRAFLRSEGQSLDPIVYVGKEGMSEGVANMLSDALFSHELVKVKFVSNKDSVKEISRLLEKATGSTLVATTGFTALFYKENPDEEKRIYILN